MSRNSQNDTRGIIIIIIVGILLLILPLVPIAWGIFALIKYFKWKKEKKQYPNKTISDFWIDEEDKNNFEISRLNFWDSKQKIEDLLNTAESENLTRNSDGSISNRSNRGKEINNQLHKYNSLKNESYNTLEFLREYPLDLWVLLKDTFTSFYASSYAFLFWFIGFYYSMKYFFKKPFLATLEIYDKIILKKERNYIIIKEDMIENFIYVLIISALTSIIIYYFTKFLAGRFIFRTRYKKPPEVTYDTVNKY